MPPSYTYRKSRREKQLRRMATMRAAKERKRMSESCDTEHVGTVIIDGPLFNGRHVIKRLYRCGYSDTQIIIDIDGKQRRPRSYRGVLRLLANAIHPTTSARTD